MKGDKVFVVIYSTLLGSTDIAVSSQVCSDYETANREAESFADEFKEGYENSGDTNPFTCDERAPHKKYVETYWGDYCLVEIQEQTII